jgi:hypothetical protein
MANRPTRSINALEIMSQLYVGDYFGDTLHFSSEEHILFRLLLLHLWLADDIPKTDRAWASTANLKAADWRAVRPMLWPPLMIAIASITTWKKAIRAYDGARLPPAEWHIVRSIVLERDGYACAYCGSAKNLHVDHIASVVRGGSNAFENLASSCAPCNLSKGQKHPDEWRITVREKEPSPSRSWKQRIKSLIQG